ncbi:hypothetical protein GCM10028773_23890 [Spirosoma koreense]
MSRVEKLLTQASECLSADMQIDAEATVARANDFHEFMNHHEWELAMETLEEGCFCRFVPQRRTVKSVT